MINKTELKDIDMLMKKIINKEPFYALEIGKAKYLLKRLKEEVSDNNQRDYTNRCIVEGCDEEDQCAACHKCQKHHDKHVVRGDN